MLFVYANAKVLNEFVGFNRFMISIDVVQLCSCSYSYLNELCVMPRNLQMWAHFIAYLKKIPSKEFKAKKKLQKNNFLKIHNKDIKKFTAKILKWTKLANIAHFLKKIDINALKTDKNIDVIKSVPFSISKRL